MKTKARAGSTGSDIQPLDLAALRLVRRRNAAFGRLRLAQVLAGRRTAGVLEHDLQRDPEFGAGKDINLVLAVLDELVKRGWLCVAGLNPNRPVLALTEKSEALARITADNPPQPPPAPLDLVQRAQARRLQRWRDLVALQDARAPRQIASVRALRALVRVSPRSHEELAASGLLADDVPQRLRRIVVDVLQGTVGDPALGDLVRALVQSSSTGAVTLTPEVLEWGRTPRGGYTRAQLAELDVTWPPPKRWQETVVGKPVSPETLRRFLEPGVAPPRRAPTAPGAALL